MSDNGSPVLVFSPDNDMDDYTQAVAYINEEFARVKTEEEGEQASVNEYEGDNVVENVGVNVRVNVGVKLSSQALALLERYGKKKREVAYKLLTAISENGQITIPEMADIIGATERTVQRYLKEFQDDNVLKREGSDKTGRWILM